MISQHLWCGGTRIAVQSVLEMLAAGDSVEDVLEAFPSLRREQVLACVDHAARLMGNQYSLELVLAKGRTRVLRPLRL